MRNYFDNIAGPYNFFMKLFGKPKKTADILKKYSNINSGFKVLDVGGGTGLIADFMSQNAKDIIVFDPSRNMLAKIKNPKIRKIQGSAEKLPFKKRTFDLVYCVDSLHHFTNRYAAKKWPEIIGKCVAELLRVLKKDGVLLIIDFDTSKFIGGIIQAFENNIMNWGSCFFTPVELRKLFEKHNAKCMIDYINSYCYIAKIVKK